MNEMTVDPAVSFYDAKFSEQMARKEGELALAIPRDPHDPDRLLLSPDRFARALLTTVSMVPKLLRCDRRSFWDAAAKCALDGLLPDGKEAALVPFQVNRRDGTNWVSVLTVQYIPMVGGYRRLVREAGIDWQLRVVHAKDKFAYVLGDEERIEHIPSTDEDPGPWTHVYAIAKLRESREILAREVMTKAAVLRIRDRAQSWKNADEKGRANSAWTIWEEEMALKTVAKKQVKMLPLSTDARIADVLRREEADERGADTIRTPAIASTGSLAEKMRALADQREEEALQGKDDDVEDIDGDGDVIDKSTGEVTKSAAPSQAADAPGAPVSTSSQQAGPQDAPGAPDAAAQTEQGRRAPSDNPPPAQPAAATAPAATSPTPAAGAGPALKLTADQAKAIRKFAETVMGAQSQRSVQKGAINFLEDQSYPEGSEAEAAVVAIRDIHLQRVIGKSSPAECDQVRDQVTKL